MLYLGSRLPYKYILNFAATESCYNLFDKNLVLYPVSSKDEITLEVKYNGFLYTYIKDAVSQADKMQISNSKYVRARMVSKKGRK
ncbi:MAG: hypothetical protein J6B68_13270 [Lachnospiraceae bacterium]|nr:hypothetical protein [Lachnospiraceae bacterium]